MRHPSASGHHYYLNSVGDGAVTGDSDRHTTALEPASMQSKVIRMNKQPTVALCWLVIMVLYVSVEVQMHWLRKLNTIHAGLYKAKGHVQL